MESIKFSQLANIAVLKSGDNSIGNLEAFDRLFLTIAIKRNYQIVNSDSLIRDFKDFYNLEISHLFVDNFIGRLTSQKCIIKKGKSNCFKYCWNYERLY